MNWYFFEVVTSVCVIADIWSLDRLHFWSALGFIGLFAVAYAQRLIGQIRARKEGGEL